MARRDRSGPTSPRAGWAIYLRTSSEEAQNPENSQRRQRHSIQRALLERANLPVVNEYVDNLSGRYANNRPGYQRMLEDARNGHFSHVAVENAERFGRDDTEALTAIDALNRLGISVRFADYPDLDPIDPDDRILVSLSFTLARRESLKLGQRVTGGLHAKLRSGGFVGKAPDGYVNCEERNEQADKTRGGRYSRWVEVDPNQSKVWRLAWDLLLTNQYTLAEICEELHGRGYYFRSGRPFVTVNKLGKRSHAANGISRIFNNWFYAGWVVSQKANIPPKTVRGQWQPLVTTEEFEQGLNILAGRQTHRTKKRVIHEYLLRGLVYVELPDGKLIRLIGSTSNAGRADGGTRYYCVASSNINIPCKKIDDQIADVMNNIQIDPAIEPTIKACYEDEVADKLGHMRGNQTSEITRKLKEIDEEEGRGLRLYTTGKITERVWNNLWAEWQDKRRTLRAALVSLDSHNNVHIANLDAALNVISRIGVLYNKLGCSQQKKLLHEMVYRVVVCPKGIIRRMELLPPFAYLQEVIDRVKGSGDGGETKISPKADPCSTSLSLSTPDRNRTCNLSLRSASLCPLSYGGAA